MSTRHGSYKWTIMHEKCGRPDINVFHIKCIIGNHGNWKKSKSWGPFWSYQLDSSANLTHLPQRWAKWAEFQNGTQDFDFFNCHVCQTFILAEIHCYLSALKSWHHNSFLSGVQKHKTLYDWEPWHIFSVSVLFTINIMLTRSKTQL